MQIKVGLMVIFFGFMLTTVYCQQPYPECLNDMAKNIAGQHKKNPCEGSDTLLRIEQYSYKDTLLYKLVFKKKNFCPDYISATVYYDDNCQIKIQISDGGLKYRHQVSPSWVDEKEIKFIKSIDRVKGTNRQDNSEITTEFTIDVKGKKLKDFYLSLNVENLWIAGSHINWETGVADKPDATAGNHTHCSAFVASACKQLGVYVLRPPEHGQILLANAQYNWLKTKDALKNGWRLLDGNDRKVIYIQAQKLANEGNVVIAIIKNPDTKKSGHAALVMPKEADVNTLKENGPSLIMAGKHNFNLISLKNGFKSHLASWPENEILFFVNNNNTL